MSSVRQKKNRTGTIASIRRSKKTAPTGRILYLSFFKTQTQTQQNIKQRNIQSNKLFTASKVHPANSRVNNNPTQPKQQIHQQIFRRSNRAFFDVPIGSEAKAK
jgi:hypothetical protein